MKDNFSLPKIGYIFVPAQLSKFFVVAYNRTRIFPTGTATPYRNFLSSNVLQNRQNQKNAPKAKPKRTENRQFRPERIFASPIPDLPPRTNLFDIFFIPSPPYVRNVTSILPV